MFTDYTNATTDRSPQTIEVDDQFYADLNRRRGYRPARDRPASKREQMLRRFQQLQDSLIRYQTDRDLDQDTKGLIARLADLKIPYHLDEFATWISQAEHLLSWIQSHVASCRAARQVSQEAAYLKDRVDSLQEFYAATEEDDFERLAGMHYSVQELLPTGLVPDKICQAVCRARARLQAEQRHEKMVETWLNWPERFEKNSRSRKSNLTYSKEDRSRRSQDSDQRRSWRRQRAKVNGRKW